MGKFFNLVRSTSNTQVDYLEYLINERAARLHVADMAIEKAITLIANVVSKSDFTVYRYNSKEKKVEARVDTTHYTLNIKPNANQYGSEFWREVIRKLLREGKALVVQLNNELFLADNYSYSEDVITARTFKDVTIGSMNVRKTFTSSVDAIELVYEDQRMRDLIATFNKEYGELLAVSAASFKRNNRLKIKMLVPASTQLRSADGTVITSDQYAKQIETRLTSDEDAVIKLGNNLEFSEALNPNNGASVKESIEVSKYIFEQVAMAFNIPIPVMYGTVSEKSDAVNDLITFAVSPIFELLQDALTDGLIGSKNYIKGERIRIEAMNVKHVDIYEIAQGLDKLFAIGFTHNELRKICGWESVDTDWANTRHVTKNYMSEAEMANQGALKGGENGGKVVSTD